MLKPQYFHWVLQLSLWLHYRENQTPDQPLSHHANDWCFQYNFGRRVLLSLCEILISFWSVQVFHGNRDGVLVIWWLHKSLQWNKLWTRVFSSRTSLADFFLALKFTTEIAEWKQGPTLTAAATVGGGWRSGGVEEEDEEVTSRPSGINLIIQLRSSQTPSGATRQRSLCDTFRYQQHNELSWSMNGERVLHLNTPTPTVFHSTYLSCLAACSLI